jgi:hypothetical protein
MVSEAFNDRPPLYHGETIEGFCGLCNELGPVTLRQWFVCSICWNVVVAYQKSFVASKAVSQFWEDDVRKKSGLPFSLLESEEVYLSGFARGAKTKKTAAASLAQLDFVASEELPDGPKPAFHIELKSGPGAVDSMREFQLDVNDFNDVVGAVNFTKLPAYIFHVQLAQEYRLPTRRTLPVAMWWTDPRLLHANLKRLARRRGEDKEAAYFDLRAFKPWAAFPEELRSRRFEQLAQAVHDDPMAFLG